MAREANSIDRGLKDAIRFLGLRQTARVVRKRYQASLGHWAPLTYPGLRLTPRRLLNYSLLRWEESRGYTRLRAAPLVLVIETGNVCDLRCPACLTGMGQAGRERSFFPTQLFARLMDEIGDRLLMVEFCNWGEPLLHPGLEDMIVMASERGICSIVSSHFSMELDESRARNLVESGLSVLGASLDGATQETYEQYRIRGDLQRALANVRLVQETKRSLGRHYPELVWEFHVFQHNKQEVSLGRRLATELGMEFVASKGWIAGPDPNPRSEYEILFTGEMPRCRFLWQRAVVQNDGGVSPCDGCFYSEDDFGHLAIVASDLGTRKFMQVWNNRSFTAARELFHDRDHEPAQKLICASCPVTANWHGYQQHVAQGLPSQTFDPGFTENDGHNFFLQRREAKRGGEPLILVDSVPTRPAR